MRAQVRRIRYVKTQNLNTGTERSARKIKSPTLISARTQTPEWGTHRTILTTASELEQVHQIADGGRVQRHVGIALGGDWVGQMIAAAIAHRSQVPIGFDELQDRSMICVSMRDVACRGEGRNHQSWNSGAVAEVIEGLDISGVVVAAAFVEGNDDGGAGPQCFVGLYFVDDLLHEALEQIEFGRRWVSIKPAVGLHKGNGRQRAVLDRLIEFGGVAQVRATGRAGHDRRGVLKRVADVAVGVVRS